MIDDVDRTLEALLKKEFGKTLPFELSFAAPDKNFKAGSLTLNCYLYDIRENRDLRSSEPQLRPSRGGTVEKVYPAARIKLTYCITAWSPAPATGAVDAAIEEHRLLGQVLAALLKYPTLPPEALAGVLAGQDPPLPTTVILPEDMRANRDFWNAVGGTLRPALDFSITAALVYLEPLPGPQVQTAQHRTASNAGVLVAGGTIWDASAQPRPVAGAWVRAQETGQTTVTDADGHYLLDRLARGSYTLAVRAVGFREGSLTVDVPPALGGAFDLQLVPL